MSADDDWEREVSTVGVSLMSTASRRLILRVLGGGAVATHALPARGVLTIGRSEEADVRIPDPSISRAHARLTIGDHLQIEDLGSQNGTRVGDRLLAPKKPVELRAGQPLELGGVMVIVQYDHGSKSEPHAVARAAPAESRDPGVVVQDEAMVMLHRLVDRVANSTLAVLIVGETGVGKEVIAEAVHRRSPRASGPFVAIQCGAMPDNLIESELFGYEKGAFSGADRPKPGLIETSDRGTLFLDEIGELSAAVQVKLLRVLERGEVQRLGAVTPRKIDMRLVSATHRDLDADVAEGKFRQDLLFRLDGVTVYVPPLRERLSELEGLSQLFLEEAARAARREVPRLTPAALERLRAHAWPGNVRELKRVLERAVVMADGNVELDVEHLQLRNQPGATSATKKSTGKPGELDRDTIVRALERCGGNQKAAAQELGISRGTLIARITEFGIDRPRKR